MSSFTSRLLKSAAIALGVGLLSATPAMAQHHGGGGGGFHGGGGGFHGGGFHGGGFRGGYRGWGGYGGWGWGYGGFYPWYGLGLGYGLYDPYWFDYESAPYYGGEDLAYGGAPYGYAQQPQQPYYPPANYGGAAYGGPGGAPGAGGMPTDNSRGFYTWQVGVQDGSCNRPYLQQIATSLTGATPAGMQAGTQLGGIPVGHVIGGRIGPRLDITDQACATEALEHTATGTPVRWETASGIPVTFIVTRSDDAQGRQPCRTYEATAQFASHTDKVTNTACKAADGSWRPTR